MGEDYVKETQTALGKIIDKPPLTDKLLKKPPFRYLHDIITEVIKKSSFMKGLYTDSEMDSKNFKDKEGKITFLQKAVEVVVMVTGKSLSVRPSKIVAGHEPEKTNEFLQALANAITKKMDSTEAVRKVLKGEKPGSGKPPKPQKDEEKKPPKPQKDEEKSKDRHSADKHKRDKENREKKGSSNRERSSSRDKEKERQKDRSKDREKDKDRSKDKDKNRERSKDRDRDKDKDKSRDKERSKDKDKERTRDKDKQRDKDKHSREKDKSRDRNKEKEKHEKEQDKEKDKEKEKDRERRERRKRKDEEEAKRKEQEEQNEDEEDDGSSSNRIQRPSSAKGQRRRPTKDNDDVDGPQDGMVNGDDALTPQVAQSRRLARPSSARPAPPRVKKQESLDDPGSRVGSGKQVSNVIVDDGSDDDDDTFVVQEAQPLVNDEPQPMNGELEEDGEHGGLVKKILETKKELEGGNKVQNKEEKPIIMDAAKRKERELIQREVEKLRGSIQTLTRSANPLGKIMDYLQEDVDSMQKELEMWKKENDEHALAIKREEGITNSELEPLQAQLSELDQSIADQLDAIAAVKSNIIRNDEKTNKMLSSVAFSR